jgi:ribosome-associated translation inhibitor RaiA
MEFPIDFVIRSGSATDPNLLRAYAERRLAFALRRFENGTRYVTVRFDDVNGPRRGVDSRCAITLQLRNGRRIDAEAMTAWPYASVTLAAKRLNAAVRREHEKARTRSSTHIERDREFQLGVRDFSICRMADR